MGQMLRRVSLITNHKILRRFLFSLLAILAGIVIGYIVSTGNTIFLLILFAFITFLWVIIARNYLFLVVLLFISVNIIFGWGTQKALAPIEIGNWSISYNYLLLIICLLSAGVLFLFGELKLPSKQLYIPILFFILLVTLSLSQTYIFSPNDRFAIFTEGGSMYFYLLLFPFVHVLRNGNKLRIVALVIVIANIIAAIFTFGYLHGFIYLPGIRNEFGEFSRSFVVPPDIVLFGWFLCWSVIFFLKRDNLLRVLAFIGLISGVYIFFASQTRTLIFTIPVGMFAFLFFVWWLNMSKSKKTGNLQAFFRVMIVLIFFFGIIGFISLIFPEEIENFINRTNNLTSQETSYYRRAIEPKVLWNYAFQQNPIFGIGIGRSFVDLYIRYDLEALREVHSNITWLLLKLGIIGLFLYLFIIYRVIRMGISNIPIARDDLQTTWLVSSVVGVFSVFIHGCIAESTLANQYDVILLVLFIAIIDNINFENRTYVSSLNH
jgi:O-antigen ligase